MTNHNKLSFSCRKLLCNLLSVIFILVCHDELKQQFSKFITTYQLPQSTTIRTTQAILSCLAIAPTIDYSHNMRILNLPKSTPIGSIIYRIKGSDADPHSHLIFGVMGIEGRSLIDVRQVTNSWNEADVYLKAPLQENMYNLTIFVTDGNKTTQVDSTIYVINDEYLTSSLSPFIASKLILSVPENTLPKEVIGHVSVLDSIKSDLPVRFELRGSDKFSIRYVFGPRGQSKAEITINQALDYEKQNMYQLVILASNAWTNTRYDTRNIASLDIIVAVQDVQDTPPIFRDLPTVLRLNNSHQIDEPVIRIFAEDGDYADQRPINYALDSTSPLSTFFDIDRDSGIIKIKKSLDELKVLQDGTPPWHALSIYASEVPDPTSYDRLWPPMYTKIELALTIVDNENEAPKFTGGFITPEGGLILKGFVEENSVAGSPIRWYSNSSQKHPMVIDLGTGANGTFELSLEGPDSSLFGLIPPYVIIRQTTFSVVVVDANSSSFDYESGRRMFEMDIVATDYGKRRLSARIKCLIDLIDINDNYPKFTQSIYSSFIYEDAPVGTVAAIIKAHDIDSGDYAKIRYSSMSGLGRELFDLNHETGAVVLIDNRDIDRETKSDYSFMIEASDNEGMGHKNYTELRISVYDINDNAPIFLQSQYDAILLPDGSLSRPLIVKAIDADQEATVNSQIAYEIVGGNYNEQFAIDTSTGLIFTTSNDNNHDPSGNRLPMLPPILTEPITPHNHQANDANLAMTHEIEDDFITDQRHQSTNNSKPKLNWPRSAPSDATNETSSFATRERSYQTHSPENSFASSTSQSITNARQTNINASKLPPLTTLIIRAHDFGIPLRSSSVKVNIHNQALLNRSISLILNGTMDQLNQKRDLIERGFAALTGTKTVIESIDSLSESSSLSVARARLMIPMHSLVDLTDLNPLISALDHGQHNDDQKVISHSSQGSQTSQLQTQISAIPTSFFNHGELGNNEHQYHIIIWILMILIIIVVISILLLLLWWLCCGCASSKVHQEKLPPKEKKSKKQSIDSSESIRLEDGTIIKQYQTNPKYIDKKSNNLAKEKNKTSAVQEATKSSQTSANIRSGSTLAPSSLRPEHLSMYNGQVWFESRDNDPMASATQSRRASSAPSGESTEHRSNNPQKYSSRKAAGEFFPNTIGFVQNLASLGTNHHYNGHYKASSHGQIVRRNRRKRVVPLLLAQNTARKELSGIDNVAFLDLEHDPLRPHKASEYYLASVADDGRIVFDDSRTNTSSSGNSHSSQHELLGFDRSGTPILAGSSSIMFNNDLHSKKPSKKTEIMYITTPINEETIPKDDAFEESQTTNKMASGNTDIKQAESTNKNNQRPKSEQIGNHALRRSKTEYILSDSSKQTSTRPAIGVTDTLDAEKLLSRSNRPEASTHVQTSPQKNRVDTNTSANGSSDVVDSSIASPNKDHTIIHLDSADSSQADEFNIKNAELMEKKSVFAIAYNGVTTDNLS